MQFKPHPKLQQCGDALVTAAVQFFLGSESGSSFCRKLDWIVLGAACSMFRLIWAAEVFLQTAFDSLNYSSSLCYVFLFSAFSFLKIFT